MNWSESDDDTHTGYMIFEALREAQSKQYSFICNPFNASETGMATVLHVFYLSKVNIISRFAFY